MQQNVFRLWFLVKLQPYEMIQDIFDFLLVDMLRKTR